MMIGTRSAEKFAIRNGKWKEFNKHGVLIAEGIYVNNRKHGVWREYYDAGGIMIEETFIYGVQHGRFASYHPTGELLSEGQYYNGRREGYFRQYDESGQNIKSLLFKNNIETQERNSHEKHNKRSKTKRS